MYALAEPAVTGRDGRYFVRVEQLAGVFAPDSVLLAVSARSLRMMDRLPDGSSRFVRRDVWAKFGKPPAQPTGLSVDIVVPLTPQSR